VQAGERDQPAQRRRSRLLCSQRGPPLVGPDEGTGGGGDRRRERDLAQEPVEPAFRRRLRTQGRLGRAQVMVLVIGKAIDLGIEAAVGGLRYRQVGGRERPQAGRGWARSRWRALAGVTGRMDGGAARASATSTSSSTATRVLAIGTPAPSPASRPPRDVIG
jgi:hypothetical protein